MSTREKLHRIIDGMNENQMQAWLLILEGREDTQTESKKASLKRLHEIIRPAPDLDYDKALAEWREERFGK